MKKVACVLYLLPLLLVAQEISVNGNRGMFKIQYAQPHNMGMFSFHMAPTARWENYDVTVQSETTTDRRFFFDAPVGLSYAIIDYLEIRTHVTPFVKYYEANDYPVQRGDPSPVIGFRTVQVGAKIGYPFVVDEETPLVYAVGIDAFVDFGLWLSSGEQDKDRALYADTFNGVAPNFPPHIPHDPDVGFAGLFDFKVGPFATHLNAGYFVPGTEKNPGYVAPGDIRERPDYLIHGGGIELIPAEAARILFEAYGMYDMDASEESLWVTPGLRFGSGTISFDLGCELGIVNPTSDDVWYKPFFNFSAGVDLVPEVRIPIATVTGKVYDASTSEPLAATITFPGSDKEAVMATDAGYYEVTFAPGSHRLHVEAPGYRWKEQGVVLKDGDRSVVDFSLNKRPVSKLTGKIYDAETQAPVMAEISFPQTDFSAVTSDTTGFYSATLGPGSIRIRVEAPGYPFAEKVVVLQEDATKIVDIALTRGGATLTGKVSEAETGTPLLAQLTFVGTTLPAATTDPTTGIYKTTVPAGTYSVKVEAQDYVMESAPVVLMKNETKIQNFTLRPVPKVGETMVLKGIYFDFNSAVIKPTSYPVLDDAARVITAKPNMRVEISGHTDSVGSDSYNQKLSNQRANAVRDYLIRYHTIDPSRLIAVGYGESQPIADNRTRSGRDLNRRIEFKILSW